MAYQLPPPPHHDDPNVRAWLFEVWKRNQDILDSSATIQITGDVTAPVTGSTNKQFVLPSTLNLDLICAIDGGDSASTYTGADFPFHSIYGKATIDTSPLSVSWTEIERIRDIQTDGTNVLIIGERPTTAISAVWKTDMTLASVTEVATYESGGDFTNFAGGRYLEFLEYIPSLDRWVCSTEVGVCYYSNDAGTTWTECTMPAGWSLTTSDITFMHWNPSLGYMHLGSADQSVMPISTDGITFTRQQDSQVLGGTHPYKLYHASTLEYGAKKTHILSQWEEYCWKDEDTGGSTGWTKTTNQGVIGGSSTWVIMGWETDGTAVACYAFGRIAVNADPTIHGDWNEYTNTDMGMVGNINIYGLLYVPEYDRPWIMARDDATVWYDAATMPTGGAPTFAESTNPDLVGRPIPVTPKWNSRGGKVKRVFGDNWAIIFAEVAEGTGSVDSVLIGRAN